MHHKLPAPTATISLIRLFSSVQAYTSLLVPLLGRHAEAEHSAIVQGDDDATLCIYLPEENSCTHEQS
jgi:hypothetical protein